MHWIRNLIKKFDTNNPLEIAEQLNIMILYEDLENLNGYYSCLLNRKFIHINNKLTKHMKKFVIAHELGHALLHENNNTPFIKYFSFININRLENEANIFAVNLLISDEDIESYKFAEYTVEQIAMICGLPKELIELRLNK
jgi:Predicted Zn peptidase